MSIELSYLVKPLKGEPCNGCGWCCQSEVCAIGKDLHGSAVAPCPSLVYADGRTYCGVVRWSSPALAAYFSERLGIGKGCCSDD